MRYRRTYVLKKESNSVFFNNKLLFFNYLNKREKQIILKRIFEKMNGNPTKIATGRPKKKNRSIFDSGFVWRMQLMIIKG